MGIHEITDLDDYYDKLMTKEHKDCLIISYFTATWCGPCKMIAPDMKKLGENSQTIVVLKIDVDECEDVASQCDIDCMPTFRFHMGNSLEPIKKLMGADKNQLFNIVGELLLEIKERGAGEANTNQVANANTILKNEEMDVPFMYNPIPDHQFN
jgi:thioredoxin 1